MAFNFGGRPIFVMPLVFGMAPIVNTITTITSQGMWSQVGPAFFGSLLVVICGAVGVLLFSPKPQPPGKKPGGEAAPAPKAVEKPDVESADKGEPTPQEDATDDVP